MQQIDTVRATTRPAAGPLHNIHQAIRPWVTGRRGLILGGIAVVAGGLALGWNWLTAVGAAPIILALAPCAVMCALGTCAMMKASSIAQQGPKDQTPTQSPESQSPGSQND